MCQGWLPMEFNVQSKTTKQALYICKKIQRLYFSKAACINIGILPKDFPNPATMTSPQADMAMQYLPSASTRQELDTSSKYKVKDQLPTRPKKLPFSQQSKTFLGSRNGSYSTLPVHLSGRTGNFHQCLALLLIST